MEDCECINKYRSLGSVAEVWLQEEFVPKSALQEAMSFSVLAPGKRFRPVLSLLVAEALELDPKRIRPWCLALEALHTASLIHDDLPAIDDDALRRGQATCHIQYGEGPAILAGDALIAKAFSLIAESVELSAEESTALCALLAQATLSLCEGQLLDLEAEKSEAAEAEDGLEKRHQHKTGALIAAAAEGPACLLPTEESLALRPTLRTFGYELGLLFQITDDILDATSNTETLGKDAGSDKGQGTPTYISLFGLEKSWHFAEQSAQRARAEIGKINRNIKYLEGLVGYVLTRER